MKAREFLEHWGKLHDVSLYIEDYSDGAIVKFNSNTSFVFDDDKFPELVKTILYDMVYGVRPTEKQKERKETRF